MIQHNILVSLINNNGLISEFNHSRILIKFRDYEISGDFTKARLVSCHQHQVVDPFVRHCHPLRSKQSLQLGKTSFGLIRSDRVGEDQLL